MAELLIETMDDLERHEADVLRRLNTEPGAGLRFLVDPFGVLAELEVRLSPQVIAELAEPDPAIVSQPPGAAAALEAAAMANVTVAITKHLFARGTTWRSSPDTTSRSS
jgi:hypothetical protein